MTAAAAPAFDRNSDLTRRFTVTPALELLVLAGAVAIAAGSYFALRGGGDPRGLIEPALVAGLLVVNLVGGIALMMLAGRRIARRRAARSPVGGEGRLHVRLVLLFSLVAAVPMLLVTIFASLLFQYGVQFWYSDRARGVFENAASMTRASYNAVIKQWDDATVTMADDLARELRDRSADDPGFGTYFAYQIFARSLSEGALFSVGGDGDLRTLVVANPYEVEINRLITPQAIRRLGRERRSVDIVTGDRIQVFTPLPGSSDTYLYAARVTDPQELTSRIAGAERSLADFRSLLARARSLQLQFNAALLLISLLIVGIAVWIALAVADRLVRPVGELVDAARRVEGGDLSARVPPTRERDEVGTLSNAFNAMTARLETQNTELVAANAQAESRRALVEAVMGGVSAGVVSIADDRTVRIINASAQTLLGLDASPVGRPLREVAPELEQVLADGKREATVQVTARGEGRTLAVRVQKDGSGPIVTFDDITQQLQDQRRAAWSDVARRIAHEIKNPLTPISLAAERLQRRYGSKVEEGDTTFARLTDTIVRQVGDLRRMVDEFSSFARMPKPVFRSASLVDVGRQTMFLHEVAHPAVRFTLVHDDPGPTLVFDRRQLGQALTNIVKNAVEAIEATGLPGGEVVMTIAEAAAEEGGTVTVSVSDTGVGLPVERDRILEPYMTTRARGTGLGLAIVKKIVEEHYGRLSFTDRPGGGTIVTAAFDPALLAGLEAGDADDHEGDDRQIAELTRTRT